MSDERRFEQLIERNGPDFTQWSDGRDAAWARRAVLASPALRTVWTEAQRLEAMLLDREQAARARIVRAGAPARIAAQVLAQAGSRWRLGPRARAIAAGLVLFAFAAGASSGWLAAPSEQDVAETYTVEGLVFGSLAGDAEWN